MNVLSPQIQCFIKIIESGSVTAAAETLSVAKSGVSKNLKCLEKSLGTKLIHWTTRRRSLTAAGEKYYRHCKQIEQIGDTANEEIPENFSNPYGTLRITAPHAVIATRLAPAIASLIKKYPKLQPCIIAEDRRLNLVEQRMDLAISVGHLPDSNYRSQKIGELSEILCVAPGFLQKKGFFDPVCLENVDTVRQWPYIASSWQGQTIRHELGSSYADYGEILEFAPSFIANTVCIVHNLVLQSLGLALLPSFLVEKDIAEKKLLKVPPEMPVKTHPVYAVHPFGNLSPKGVVALIRKIRKQMAAEAL